MQCYYYLYYYYYYDYNNTNSNNENDFPGGDYPRFITCVLIPAWHHTDFGFNFSSCSFTK